MPGHREDVLVAAPAHVHHDDMVGRQPRRDLHHMGQRMRGLQRRDDSLQLAAELERLQRLGIRDLNMFGPTHASKAMETPTA